MGDTGNPSGEYEIVGSSSIGGWGRCIASGTPISDRMEAMKFCAPSGTRAAGTGDDGPVFGARSSDGHVAA